MKVLRTVLVGIVGAITMSAAMFLLRIAGIPVSFEALLGSLLGDPSNPTYWMAGLAMHVLFGIIVAFGYMLTFEVVERSGLLMGAGLGLAHGLMAGLFMSGIPAMNPLAPNAQAPGPFLAHLSFGPVIFLALHALYGAAVGLTYGHPIHEHGLTIHGNVVER